MVSLKRFSDISSDDLNKLIEVHYNHWSMYSDYMSMTDTSYKFKELYTDNKSLPIGYALYDNDLIGFCVIKKDNLNKYPDLTPWISDVMILKEYRHKGYGRKLIDLVIKEVKKMNYNEVYLWTDKAPDFYKKLGFEFKMMVEKNNNEGFGELYYKKI